MKKIKLYLFVIMYLTSCGSPYSDRLEEIENYINKYPDSAYNVLMSMPFPDMKQKKIKAKYSILLTYAIDKHDGSLPDSLLRIASDYYSRKGSDSDRALAQYLFGLKFYHAGKYDEAFNEFVKAKSIAKNTDNLYLKGLIEYYLSYLYQKNKEFSSALNSISEGIMFFDMADSKHNKAILITLLAHNYYLQKEFDEALLQFSIGIEIFKNENIIKEVLNSSTNIAMIYLVHHKDPNKALSYLLNIYKEYNNGEIPPNHYRTLSYIYNRLGEVEKAIDLLKAHTDMSNLSEKNKMSSLLMLAEYQASLGEHKEAYRMMRKHWLLRESHDASETRKMLSEIEQKYAKQELEIENDALKKRILYQGAIAVAVLIIFVLIILKIISDRKRVQAEREQIFAERERLAIDIETVKERFNDLLIENAGKQPILNKALGNSIARLQKMLDVIATYGNNPNLFNEKIKNIMVGSEKDILFMEIKDYVNNKLYGFAEYLSTDFPELKDDEIIICCLLCLDFTNNQIGILLGHSNSGSIFTKRHKIRKKILAYPNYDSLEIHLKSIVEDLKEQSDKCVTYNLKSIQP